MSEFEKDGLNYQDLTGLIKAVSEAVATQVLNAYAKGNAEENNWHNRGQKITNEFSTADTTYTVLSNNYIRKKNSLDIPLIENREMTGEQLNKYYQQIGELQKTGTNASPTN